MWDLTRVRTSEFESNCVRPRRRQPFLLSGETCPHEGFENNVRGLQRPSSVTDALGVCEFNDNPAVLYEGRVLESTTCHGVY